ncbi:hypothetical protein BOX15_Mlig005192g1 [Macrostomum lignano]|uniref:Protein kinase domain-containing protein n=1 Tax=Macrostomum lignano TaxID=282301 RepID=A0A267H6X9_9PLAT|nr:hypothetical protein BOX15_Mlig005192g1 [Macrostomum lignano]
MAGSNKGLNRCVSIENSETGRSLMARSNHRIYKKELQEDFLLEGDTIALLSKGDFVAMKQYCGSISKKDMKELCQKEYELLSKCDHKNIVTVLDCTLEVDENNPKSWPVIFMELGECSLQFALTAKRKSNSEFTYPTGDGGYTWYHCINWLRQVAEAMAYLHNNGIVHRDLKSSNVLLFEGKRLCKVCDFDMSRYYDPDGMTVDIGTWRWMAPEVHNWRNGGKKLRYDFKADCYSFGILICESIYRQRPFDSYEERLFQRLEIPSTPDLELDLPEAFGAMTLSRPTSNEDWKVVLDRSKSVFPLTDNLWRLVENLLSWSPDQRHDANLIESKLAIENPRPALQGSSESTPDGADLPQLIDTEAEADAEEPTPTDTGLPGNRVCPQIPSVRRVVKLLYSVSTDGSSELTDEEKCRIEEVLKLHADNVSSFLLEEEEPRQVSDSDTGIEESLANLRTNFRFTEVGQLELEISGANPQTCRTLAGCCRKESFMNWMAVLFKREMQHKRLNKIRFCLAAV